MKLAYRRKLCAISVKLTREDWHISLLMYRTQIISTGTCICQCARISYFNESAILKLSKFRHYAPVSGEFRMKKSGINRDSNPGPLAPLTRIITPRPTSTLTSVKFYLLFVTTYCKYRRRYWSIKIESEAKIKRFHNFDALPNGKNSENIQFVIISFKILESEYKLMWYCHSIPVHVKAT